MADCDLADPEHRAAWAKPEQRAEVARAERVEAGRCPSCGQELSAPERSRPTGRGPGLVNAPAANRGDWRRRQSPGE